jgi:hypothetical protein
MPYRNAKRTFAVPLGDIDPTDWMNRVEIEGAELVAQRPALFRRRHHDMINAGCRFAVVHLGEAPHAFQRVRPAFQHQALERSPTRQIALS